MDKLLFWLGLGAAQKGAGSKEVKPSRHPVISFVVGILIAVLIAAGARLRVELGGQSVRPTPVNSTWALRPSSCLLSWDGTRERAGTDQFFSCCRLSCGCQRRKCAADLPALFRNSRSLASSHRLTDFLQ